MSIAITEDHRALAETASDLLTARGARGAARALLTAETEERPPFWGEVAEIGWLGLHLPEGYGGSGFGMEELVVLVEELGRTVTPGPFVPTVIASALLAAAAGDDVKAQHLPGLADGSVTAAVAPNASVTVAEGKATGSAVVVGAGLASFLLVAAGDDVALVPVGDGVELDTPKNLDPTRRSSRVTFTDAPATLVPGARQLLLDYSRLLFSAEAVGVARACTDQAAEYARDRQQFGRAIGTFQAVKHHCANMAVATELATAAVWDAARAAVGGGDEFSFAAAVAATLAAPAVDLCANLNTQVHGGIAMTWEHDAHLFMRRGTVLLTVLDAEAAASDVTELTRRGVERSGTVDLPPEAEQIREEVQAFVATIKDLHAAEQRAQLVASGYGMPHWPKPWGRDAKAVEQLVIEQEFAAAGIERPSLGITGWNVLTLIQHGTPEQVERWVPSALSGEVIWCQLFSEPDAGSDAAGVKTRATKVDGGWKINGQKVWTSGAHVAGMGFATVRTNPDVPKHQGITMMVVDMHAPGVEVRPLKMTTGESGFNEVFFDDVFVPDEDVVGAIDGGWTVARATLGNESVSIGGGESGRINMDARRLLKFYAGNEERLPGGEGRIGRYGATHRALTILNLRSAHRAVANGEPGPEGAITKLVLSEVWHEAAALTTDLNGTDALFLDGAGAISGSLVLFHRGMSIAGGTSEIKRNQIGERILGLPRDPLIV